MTTTTKLQKYLHNLDEDDRKFVLGPNEDLRFPEHEKVMVKRILSEDDIENYSFEVWDLVDNKPTLLLYLNNKMHPDSIVDSWEYLKKIWSNDEFWTHTKKKRDENHPIN